jgi:hypothetical protein
MFVPSVSWQNDRFYIQMAQKYRFSQAPCNPAARMTALYTAAAAAAVEVAAAEEDEDELGGRPILSSAQDEEAEADVCDVWAELSFAELGPDLGAPKSSWIHYTIATPESQNGATTSQNEATTSLRVAVELRVLDKVPTRFNEAGWCGNGVCVFAMMPLGSTNRIYSCQDRLRPSIGERLAEFKRSRFVRGRPILRFHVRFFCRLGFETVQPDPTSSEWTLSKLGTDLKFDEVVRGGSPQMHAVDGVTARLQTQEKNGATTQPRGGGGTLVTIDSLDAPLLSAVGVGRPPSVLLNRQMEMMKVGRGQQNKTKQNASLSFFSFLSTSLEAVPL